MSITTILTTVRPRLDRMASRLPDRIREDAVQEATIVIWQEEDRILDARLPEALATAIGATVVRRFDSSRPATGAPARSIGSGRARQRSTGTISSDWLTELGIDVARTYADDLDTRLDVEAALVTLPRQDYEIVINRFFVGLSWRETGERVGLSTSGVFNRWDRHIRPTLASALSER